MRFPGLPRRTNTAAWLLPAALACAGALALQGTLTPGGRQWAARQTGIVYFVRTTTRAVALTFDDGPDPRDTPAVLAALNAAGIRATFFVLGDAVRRHPDLARAIVAQGSEIGVHSWSHPNMAGMGAAAIGAQVIRTADLVQEVTGIRPVLFRFPYFAHAPPGVTAVRALGFAVIEASVDPKDWTHPGAAAIVRRATDGVQPGDILLFHDGGGQSQTVAALPQVIARLRAMNLQPVTVGALLQVGNPSYETAPPETAPSPGAR